MSPAALLLPIKPNYAESIFRGEKRIELRKKKPKSAFVGLDVYVYATSPICMLIGKFSLGEVFIKPIEELWSLVSDRAGIKKDQYFKYFSGKDHGIALSIENPTLFKQHLDRRALRTCIDGFCPPQSFRYLQSNHVERISYMIK